MTHLHRTPTAAKTTVSAMETTRSLLLVCLSLSVLVHATMAAPALEGGLNKVVSSATNTLRARRSAAASQVMEVASPLLSESSPERTVDGLLSRLRRSMAQMYQGNIHYNSHRSSGHRRRNNRRMRRRHRHHRRHGGGRVYEA